MAAWAARRGVWPGVLLGLAVATKFYPLVVFGPLLLLCLRAGQLREFAKTLAAAAAAWLAVNLPVMIAAPAGWASFYVFSKDRGADWGSIWYLFEHFNVPGARQPADQRAQPDVGRLPGRLRSLAIAVLALAAPRRPRLPQLCFLMLAAFLMTNKVWSPQYVIWLRPARRSRPAPAVAVRPVAAGRGRLLLRHLGLSDRSCTAPATVIPATTASAPAGTSPPSWPGSSP